MAKNKKEFQSQNFKNAIISGSQIGQSFGDIRQTNTNYTADNGKPLIPKEIINLVEAIQLLIKNSDLPNDSKTKCDRHLQTLKDEIQEKKPNKDFAALTLQKVINVLKETEKAFGSDTSLIDNVQPIITKILPWLGETKKFIVV